MNMCPCGDNMPPGVVCPACMKGPEKMNLYIDNSGGIWLDTGKDTVRIVAQQRPVPESGYGKTEYELYNKSDCYELKRGYVELTWGPLEVYPVNADAHLQ